MEVSPTADVNTSSSLCGGTTLSDLIPSVSSVTADPGHVEETNELDVVENECQDDECESFQDDDDDDDDEYSYEDSDDEMVVEETPPSVRKWHEPSREAVNMSLRAEKETNSSKRRLAQDLYRIMNKDTRETGFSLQPSKEDCMDKWTIKLFAFDEDSDLAKDMQVLGLECIRLEMSFPDQYPFEPPFVRVVQPRFTRGTGFVIDGALCMELLTKEGWNPVNDIETVIVSVRSMLVEGGGRLEAAGRLPEALYNSLLEQAAVGAGKMTAVAVRSGKPVSSPLIRYETTGGGCYTEAGARKGYEYLSNVHKGGKWSDYWAKKG